MAHRGLCLIVFGAALLAGPPAQALDRENRLQDAPISIQVIDRVNVERAGAGCGALDVNELLTAAADRHSRDMGIRGIVTHTGSDGSTVGRRVRDAGYQWQIVGENITEADVSAIEVVDVWMKSPRHRENIVNCAYRDTGVSMYFDTRTGRFYWVQVFAVPFKR